MAKKQRKTVDEYLNHFHFANMTEYLIFMAWALFVTAFLLTIIN